MESFPESMIGFANSIMTRLAAAGVTDARLISARSEPEYFGNAIAVVSVAHLVLRFSLDRSEEMLDVAFDDAPDRFFQIDDVDVAMGWKSLEDVFARSGTENLDVVIHRFSAHQSELVAALSGPGARFARARIERAARERGEAVMHRLRGST